MTSSKSVLVDTSTLFSGLGWSGPPSQVLITISEGDFEAAGRALARYDDQAITLVDHMTAVLANDSDVEGVFSFDSGFRILGFTVVPDDVPEP